jgi:asparagine synthase (glutamine-hydrolysing)
MLGNPTEAGVAGLQRLDVATYLPGDLLPKSDIASMAHSLELRSPLLDHRVLELGLSLPEHLKQKGLEGKLALRRAFADDLPPLVAARGKSGFGVPLAAWFRGELKPLARELLLDERARARGLFHHEAVARLLDEHDAGRADHGHRLWTLVMLELWQRTHIDASAPAPAAVTAS